MTSRRGTWILAVVCIAAAFSVPPAADAHWITALTREAAEVGARGASHVHPNLGAIGRAAEHLQGLASAPKGALAAHATPEGHWQFVNREGQTFTAGTADEFKRIVPSLAPDLPSGSNGKLSLYLSEDSVFENRVHLDKLPKDAELHVVTNDGAYPIKRTSEKITALIKPNVSLELIDHALFDETVAALGRQLNTSNVRTISLQPGSPNILSSAPKFDAATKTALVDDLDPANLAKAFRSIRGQTALVTGRVEGTKIFFQPARGAEFSREVDELMSAAAQSDVNLVVLQADTPRQPGGRNWLWQKIEVGGLDEAMKTATVGDFLEALAARNNPLTLAAAREGSGRVAIRGLPSAEGGGIGEGASHTKDEWLSHVTGEVITKSLEIHVRDQASQREIDGQLIPGIPTYVQIPYLAGLVCGLISFSLTRSWWRWLAGPQNPDQTGGRMAIFFKRLPGNLVFLLIFLPIVGVPAILWEMAVQTWATITAPFRWLARVFRGRTA